MQLVSGTGFEVHGSRYHEGLPIRFRHLGSCNLVIRVLCEVQPSMNCKRADDKVIACCCPDACSLSQPIAERQTTSGHYATAVPVFEPP